MSTTTQGFRIIGHAIAREPLMFVVAVTGSLLVGVLTIADAWVLGWATDHVLLPAFDGEDVRAGLIWAVAALFVGVAILRAAGLVMRRIGGGLMVFRMQTHSRRAVSRQYLSLPMSWHHRHPTGELLSNANSDVEAAWSPLNALGMAIGTMAMVVIAVGQMLATDLLLACVGLLVFPLTIWANFLFQRYSSPLYVEGQRLRAELSAVAHESFDGALVVKTLGREHEETLRFDRVTQRLREVNVRAGRIRSVFDPVLAIVPNLGVLAVLAIGVLRVVHGSIEAGDVVTVAYLVTLVSFPIRSVGWLLGEFPRSVVGYTRVRAVIDARGETRFGDAVLPAAAGPAGVEVDGVTFAYPGEPEVLSGLSVSLPPGSSVALVGATASGKSTVTALLARLVDPEAGEIRVDGVPLPDLAPGQLATALSLVQQTAFVFDDTVRGNVTLGAPYPDEEVWEALRTAQAEGFVAALPRGLDTVVGERGASLSGGQRQRIALARALVRHPRLLVLDDATSAVDADVERQILERLRAEETTLVVVAYRKATIALADEVLYLSGGRVVDRGPHAELLERNPDYAALVNAYETDAEGDAA